MGVATLTAFWVQSPFKHAPLGFGVTAWSLDDALAIIRAPDYGSYLPDDLAGVRVTAAALLDSRVQRLTGGRCR